MDFEIKHIRHQTIPSTHAWAKEHASELDPHGITCITSKEQTAGRGQFDRSFICGPGNIYATFYFTIPQQAPYLANLGQLLSLSFATVLEKAGILCQIKWPNDLLLKEKKLAGVLCEICSNGVILSIGINVNMPQELLTTIDQPATSLAVFTDRPWDEEVLLNTLCTQFVNDLQEIMQHGFAPMVGRFCHYLTIPQSMLHVQRANASLKGTFHSIDPQGRMVIQTDQGLIIIGSAKEIL